MKKEFRKCSSLGTWGNCLLLVSASCKSSTQCQLSTHMCMQMIKPGLLPPFLAQAFDYYRHVSGGERKLKYQYSHIVKL